MIETLQGENFREVFNLYNRTKTDDPGGAGTGPGPSFPIRGLDPQVEDPDGFVGEIVFPVGMAPGRLREDVDLPEIGMPRDLTGDGIVAGGDVSSSYRILPVLIRIEWRGKAGNGQLEFKTILSPY